MRNILLYCGLALSYLGYGQSGKLPAQFLNVQYYLFQPSQNYNFDPSISNNPYRITPLLSHDFSFIYSKEISASEYFNVGLSFRHAQSQIRDVPGGDFIDPFYGFVKQETATRKFTSNDLFIHLGLGKIIALDSRKRWGVMLSLNIGLGYPVNFYETYYRNEVEIAKYGTPSKDLIPETISLEITPSTALQYYPFKKRSWQNVGFQLGGRFIANATRLKTNGPRYAYGIYTGMIYNL